MINNTKLYLLLILSVMIGACNDEAIIIGENVSDRLWLEHEGAQMPILVEGNTASKTFILMLHGGPGETSLLFNETNIDMSVPLEKRYAVAYWDQRLSGNSKGHLSKDKVTLELMLEDTDQAVELLKHRYGQDINIFLLGHSWGGYLGSAYLAQSESNQAKINGWIDVSGDHNIEKTIRDGLSLMKEVAQNQININSKMTKDWEDILSYSEEAILTEVIDKDFIFDNAKKTRSATTLAQKEELINTIKPTGKEVLSYIFKDNHLILTLVNVKQMFVNSDIYETILTKPLSDELPKIKTPSLILWGKYDFVVPPSLGEEAFQNLGTAAADKSLHFFDHSGHLIMFQETDKFVDLVIQFVDTYK